MFHGNVLLAVLVLGSYALLTSTGYNSTTVRPRIGNVIVKPRIFYITFYHIFYITKMWALGESEFLV